MPAQFGTYLEWLSVERNRPRTTVRTYRQDLAKFVAFLSTTVDLRSPDVLEGVDRAVLRRYQIELADVLPNPRTRNRSLVVLRNFLRFAYDEGWTDEGVEPAGHPATLRDGRPAPDPHRRRSKAARRVAEAQPA